VKLTHLSCGEEENRRHSVVLRRTQYVDKYPRNTTRGASHTRELRRGTPEKSHRERRVEDARTGKKTPGEPGHTQAHGHTDEPHNHPNPPTHPSDRETTESAADSTAAAPEPTAPRGRLGGRPLRTRRSRHPLHRGEPDTLTRQTTPEPRGQTTRTPRRTHRRQPPHTSHTRSSSVVVTVMATVPRRESSEDRPHPGGGAQEGASVRRSRAMLT